MGLENFLNRHRPKQHRLRRQHIRNIGKGECRFSPASLLAMLDIILFVKILSIRKS